MNTFVIAEAGINHNGSLTEAMRLAESAKDAGADAVKYQFFSSQSLWGDERIKQYEFSLQEFQTLATFCGKIGIEFMCSPFGVWELERITPLVKRMKIASGLLRREFILRAARAANMPIILSTGMSTYAEIRVALEHLRGADVTLLHCTSSYPCLLQHVNLRAMQAMRNLGCLVGYSDHTDGIIVALAAVGAGARVIEKHLTLDRNAEGPDHKASIEPAVFKEMVMHIRAIDLALGTSEKYVQECEKPLREAWK